MNEQLKQLFQKYPRPWRCHADNGLSVFDAENKEIPLSGYDWRHMAASLANQQPAVERLIEAATNAKGHLRGYSSSGKAYVELVEALDTIAAFQPQEEVLVEVDCPRCYGTGQGQCSNVWTMELFRCEVCNGTGKVSKKEAPNAAK